MLGGAVRGCRRFEAWQCPTRVARQITRTNFTGVTAEEAKHESELYFQRSPTNRYEYNKKSKWNRTYEERYALKMRPGAEEAAHNMTERVPVDQEYQADHARWWEPAANKRKAMLLQSARYFKIFDHLSPSLARDMNDIYVRNNLAVEYDVNGSSIPIVSGNNLPAMASAAPPKATWFSEPPTTFPEALRTGFMPRDPLAKYTLAMVSLDGNLENSDTEKLHWLVTNAANGTTAGGVNACTYAQLLPFKGTGCHRFVFLLLHQKSDIPLAEGALDNQRGVFSVETFMDIHKLSIDGFCFGQVTWDESVTAAYKLTHGTAVPDISVKEKPAFKAGTPKKKRYNHLNKSLRERGRK